MFCPKCGVRNLDDVKFCRACGTDIHLVPQALAGSLTTEKKEKEEKDEPPTLEKGLENIFSSFACIFILALGYFYFTGWFWVYIWFVFPAFSSLGKGIGQIIRSRRPAPALPPAEHETPPRVAPTLHGPAPHALSAADTAEIAPPSVTEQTTRSLGSAAPGATRNAH